MPFKVGLVDGVSVFVGIGAISADEAIAAMSDWYPKHPTERAIFDLRQASLSEMRASEFERLANVAASFGPLRGDRPRTAIITRPDAIDAFVISAYSARLEVVSPIEHRQFNDFDAALAWLANPSSACA